MRKNNAPDHARNRRRTQSQVRRGVRKARRLLAPSKWERMRDELDRSTPIVV